MGRPIIEVSRLSKHYELGRFGFKTLRDDVRRWLGGGGDTGRIGADRRFWALRGVSFEVGRGEVLGIIGHNGAGKSTLCKILSRITEPSEGEAVMRGRTTSLLEVGTGFHPDLTGRENIFLNGTILGMKTREIRRQFDEIVAFSGVERFLDTPVRRYSSGMQVRLAGVMFILDNAIVGTNGDNLFQGFRRVGAFFGEPVRVVVHRVVHRAAGFTHHAAERQVFESRAKATARMSLDVGKIDQEAGILNHPRYFPGFNILVGMFIMGIEILFLDTRRGVHRAAERFGRVTALFRAFRIPIDIHHKGFPAAILHSLHHAAHKDRVDSGIAHIIAGVHLNRHDFIFYPVAQVKLIDNQVELGGQGFPGLEVRLARRTKKNFAGHV